MLRPLESLVAGRESKEEITWTQELSSHYEAAERHVSEAKSIILSRNQTKVFDLEPSN